jgi:hypothetical protein
MDKIKMCTKCKLVNATQNSKLCTKCLKRKDYQKKLLGTKHKRPKEIKDLKVCTECKEAKAESEFRLKKKIGDKRVTKGTCKVCDKKKTKERNKKKKKPIQIKKAAVVLENSLGDVHLVNHSLGGKFITIEIIDPIILDHIFKKNLDELKRILKLIAGTGTCQINFEIKANVVNIKDKKSSQFERPISMESFIKINSKQKLFDDITTQFLNLILNMNENNEYISGLIVMGLKSVIIKIVPFDLVKKTGGSYVLLPPKFRRLQSLLNIKNKNNDCLYYCLAASEFINNIKFNNQEFKKLTNKQLESPNLYESMISKYKNNLADNLPLENIIPIIAETHHINIKIYELDETESETYTINLFLSTNVGTNFRYVNLLLWQGHLVLILNLNNLFSFDTKSKSGTHVCDICGSNFYTRLEALENHKKFCLEINKGQAYELVNESKNPKSETLVFSKFNELVKLPFFICGDFESYFSKKNLKDNTQQIKYLNSKFNY